MLKLFKWTAQTHTHTSKRKPLIHGISLYTLSVCLSVSLIQCGDGTTGVVLLAESLIQSCCSLQRTGISPHVIRRCLCEDVCQTQLKPFFSLKNLSLSLSQVMPAIHTSFQKISLLQFSDRRTTPDLLQKEACITSLNSKLLRADADFFADLILQLISFITRTAYNTHVSLIHLGIHIFRAFSQCPSVTPRILITSGAVRDSHLIGPCSGLAFSRPFHYSGHDLLPKQLTNPKILFLSAEVGHPHAHTLSLF